MLFASTSQAQVKLGARQYPLGPATLRRYPARHGARRRRCPPDPPPATPLPCLVHRLPDPRAAHPGRHRRHPVARDQRLRHHRDHQRPHRGLQPADQTGQTRRLRLQQSAQLDPPDTIPLHPQTADRNPDFMLIARSKSKSRYESRGVVDCCRVDVAAVVQPGWTTP